MSDLSGHVALVTGGSRGIGLAVAKALRGAGAKVMLTARTGVEAAVADVGGDTAGVVCDISDFAQAENAVAETRKRFGDLSILVNNAGVIEPIGPLTESDPSAWARDIQINLIGGYYMARAALPGMIAAGRGVIVNVSSGAAHNPLEGWSAYCSAKAGMAMLTKMIHLENKSKGIRVYGFGPGTVDTGMQVKIRASGINPISRIPREKLGGKDNPGGQPESPATLITYLASDAAADLAGEELSILDKSFRQRAGLAAL